MAGPVPSSASGRSRGAADRLALWITIVDLTPASERPYVGSTSDNSEFSLAFGYNGFHRLLGSNQRFRVSQPHLLLSEAPIPASTVIETTTDNGLSALLSSSWQMLRFNQQLHRQQTLDETGETGPPGPFRLFGPPLNIQIAWLLPSALLGTSCGLLADTLALPTHTTAAIAGSVGRLFTYHGDFLQRCSFIQYLLYGDTRALDLCPGWDWGCCHVARLSPAWLARVAPSECAHPCRRDASPLSVQLPRLRPCPGACCDDLRPGRRRAGCCSSLITPKCSSGKASRKC